MMTKVLLQFATLVVVFFGTWLVLSQIHFVAKFDLENIGEENEKKLAEVIFESIKGDNDEIENDSIITVVNNIKEKICVANALDEQRISIHILRSKQINAMTLPNKKMIIFSALIEYCNTPEELASVMAHEFAHMEHKHVTKKIIKDIGLPMLITMAGGEASGRIMREIINIISSTAFDRQQETAADETAVHYLANAHIDPKHFAHFLLRLEEEKKEKSKLSDWISTHPNSSDRAAAIMQLKKKENVQAVPIMEQHQWEQLKKIK